MLEAGDDTLRDEPTKGLPVPNTRTLSTLLTAVVLCLPGCKSRSEVIASYFLPEAGGARAALGAVSRPGEAANIAKH